MTRQHATGRQRLETRLIHGGTAPDAGTGATAIPIFQTAAFAYESAEAIEQVFAGREPGYVYTRIGNPTVSAFEQRLVSLEEGRAGLACASGMAAISATVLALAGTGDEIVSSGSIFGGTYSLFHHTLQRCGITARFAATGEPEAYRRLLSDRTRLIFVETIGNPKLDVPDIAALGAVARAHGIPLIVDNTVTSPALFQPKRCGADVVIHSTSKYINGHGTAIGGLIVDCGTADWSHPRQAPLKPWYDRAREMAFIVALRNQVARDLGGCLSPFNAFLMLTGIESLAVRMERHCANALRVAETLAGDDRLAGVNYPGLAAHPDHAVAQAQFGGRFGALLTLRLGSKERAFRFLNGLRLISNLANLGDAKTLAIHPASTFCRDANAAERQMMGVTEDLVRLAIGLEHSDDILEDITTALAGA